MQWNKLTDIMPPGYRKVIFAQWYPNWKQFVSEYYGKLEDAQVFRKFELENKWTHWIDIPATPEENLPPPAEAKDVPPFSTPNGNNIAW